MALAVGRLYLDNFRHVKAFWINIGAKLAQLSLYFGVDDIDGTVVEEKISHAAGAHDRAGDDGRRPGGDDPAGGEGPGRAGHALQRRPRMARGRAARVSRETAELIEKARRSGATVAEGARLLREAPLFDLGRAADAVRRRLHPDGVVTYIVDRNINYTNICTCGCHFCAFYRKKDAPDAYVLSEEELSAKIEETIAAGGVRVLLQGGLHPDWKIEDAVRLVRAVKRHPIRLHGFSPARDPALRGAVGDDGRGGHPDPAGGGARFDPRGRRGDPRRRGPAADQPEEDRLGAVGRGDAGGAPPGACGPPRR